MSSTVTTMRIFEDTKTELADDCASSIVHDYFPWRCARHRDELVKWLDSDYAFDAQAHKAYYYLKERGLIERFGEDSSEFRVLKDDRRDVFQADQ